MKMPSKQSRETAKTVVISILITGIITFILGVQYQKHYTNAIRVETQVIETTVTEQSKK